MVLQGGPCGRVGRRRTPFTGKPRVLWTRGFSAFYGRMVGKPLPDMWLRLWQEYVSEPPRCLEGEVGIGQGRGKVVRGGVDNHRAVTLELLCGAESPCLGLCTRR